MSEASGVRREAKSIKQEPVLHSLAILVFFVAENSYGTATSNKLRK